MHIRALRATLNKTDHSLNSVSLLISWPMSSIVIPAWLKTCNLHLMGTQCSSLSFSILPCEAVRLGWLGLDVQLLQLMQLMQVVQVVQVVKLVQFIQIG